MFGGSSCGIVLCTWVAPVIVSMLHGGLHEVTTIPITQHVFPDVLPWMSPAASELLGGVKIVFAMAGMMFGPLFGVPLWRCIVVRMLQWMTIEDFKMMLSRYPGF